MIDCGITENYLKEKTIMCKSIGCKDCPLGQCGCDETQLKISIQECVDIIQKWSDAHHQKTYLEDFFEKYPNAPMSGRDGTPAFCPSDIGLCDLSQCEAATNCAKCWNQPTA